MFPLNTSSSAHCRHSQPCELGASLYAFGFLSPHSAHKEYFIRFRKYQTCDMKQVVVVQAASKSPRGVPAAFVAKQGFGIEHAALLG